MTIEIDEVVCGGGEQDFLTARHLRVSGDHFQIGQDLARIWVARHGGLLRRFDPLTVRAQREWMSANWPQNYDRARGAAYALGVAIDAAHAPLSLPYNLPEQLLPPVVAMGNCSCVFYPPSSVSGDDGILARNLDFSTGTLFDVLGIPGPTDAPRHVSQPYVVETRPTQGHETLVLCYFDLMAACLDGINSEGLAVALMQDNESIGAGEAPVSQGAGAQDGTILRLILESCASVEDAKATFLKTKLAFMQPTHFIFADASGAATVAERSKYGDIHFTDLADGPLCVTNHLLFSHEATPSDLLVESMTRLATLEAATRAGKFTQQDIRANNEAVACVQPLAEAPTRTIWTSVWSTRRCSLEIDFYLGETEDGRVRRSEILEFAL